MENIDIEKIKKVYFIGIGGIGISAIARFMKSKGKEVIGSDSNPNPSKITISLESLGIQVNYGQKEENITDDIDLVIYTAAVPKTNPELKTVLEKGIEHMTYTESLGVIFNDHYGISVCGTHGKSTTTAIAGALLEDADFDPSVLVGSIVPRYDSNLRIGRSKYFVAESCEYERHFLYLYPQVIILNNIELDHTDYYHNLEDMQNAFLEFAGHLPETGVLIYNGDDANVAKVVREIKSSKPRVTTLSFGKRKSNDIFFQNFKIEKERARFEVFHGEKSLGVFSLRIPGEFNVYNAMAAIALGIFLEIAPKKMQNSLESFVGIWRRFEIKGKYRNALVISDYAHHPTAVKNTIWAAKEFYPDKNIFAVFQPHQHNRTKNLYQDFLKSFSEADKVLLVEIYDVAGREEEVDQGVSSKNLVSDIQRLDPSFVDKIDYATNLEEARQLIDAKLTEDDVLLMMGAGDIYLVADEMAKL